MPADDKVAFYLRHRLLIEQWTPLREQAVTALDTAFDRAVESVRERWTTPEIVNDGTFAYPLYRINLEVPDAGRRVGGGMGDYAIGDLATGRSQTNG